MGGGYIGSHMVQHLLASGHEVVVADNFSSGFRYALIAAGSPAVIKLDIVDGAALSGLFSSHRFDAVLHFASFIQVGESVTEPGKYYANNLSATLTLLQAMVKAGVNRLIFSSTVAVHGESESQLLSHEHGTHKMLKYWKDFCKETQANPAFCDAVTRENLNRFVARFRLAERFSGLTADGYSPRALRGYSAGIQLMLAYSAAEQLGKALNSPITSWELQDPALAQPLRHVLRKPSQSHELFTSTGLRKRVQEFVSGDTDNIRIAATALRVLVAHGSFTPTGTEALTQKGAQAIDGLAKRILEDCHRRWVEWFQSLKRLPLHE